MEKLLCVDCRWYVPLCPSTLWEDIKECYPVYAKSSFCATVPSGLCMCKRNLSLVDKDNPCWSPYVLRREEGSCGPLSKLFEPRDAVTSPLTGDRATPYREGVEVSYLVSAGARIFAGSLVCVSVYGYAVPAADREGYKFIGVALSFSDNSTGVDGALFVRVRRLGVFEFDALGLKQHHVGDLMYVVNDHTFAPIGDEGNGPACHILCGRLVNLVEYNKGWIAICQE